MTIAARTPGRGLGGWNAARDVVPFRRLTCGNPLIAEVYAARKVPVAGGGQAPMEVYIPREEGDLLYSLVRHLRPLTTVEVGMANGLSTLFIAEALEDNRMGSHIAIDPYQGSEWRNAGVELIRQAGLSARVQLRESCSHQALPDLERSGARAQLAFVDGAHLFDYVIADFLSIDRLLDVGGLIAFDDSDWPAVRQAIRFVLANRDYEVAFPEVVIEHRPPTPTRSAQVLRRLGNRMPKLREKLRTDFMIPDEAIGVQGRCIVLRKLGEDGRDSQSRCHVDF
jgi:predicted O-methyltransferase YrrM